MTMPKQCCKKTPLFFTREGADHHGVDLGIKCLSCRREWFVEGNKLTDAIKAKLVEAWNADKRVTTVSWEDKL